MVSLILTVVFFVVCINAVSYSKHQYVLNILISSLYFLNRVLVLSRAVHQHTGSTKVAFTGVLFGGLCIVISAVEYLVDKVVTEYNRARRDTYESILLACTEVAKKVNEPFYLVSPMVFDEFSKVFPDKLSLKTILSYKKKSTKLMAEVPKLLESIKNCSETANNK